MKNFSLILLALLAFGQVVWAQTQEPVQYISRSWNGTEVVATEQTLSSYVELSGNHPNEEYQMQGGVWYVIKDADVKYKSLKAINVIPSPKIILCDGAKLTAQITINSSDQLEIYGQSGNTGQLVANAYEVWATTNYWRYSAGIGSAEEEGD